MCVCVCARMHTSPNAAVSDLQTAFSNVYMGLHLSVFLEAYLTFLQTQYVWWMEVLMGGDICSTCQMDNGQLSVLRTSTLQMLLLSVHNLVIPRESFQLVL